MNNVQRTLEGGLLGLGIASVIAGIMAMSSISVRADEIVTSVVKMHCHEENECEEAGVDLNEGCKMIKVCDVISDNQINSKFVVSYSGPTLTNKGVK